MAVQAAFVAYVVVEMIVALATHLHATENTSSIGMKGDTAVTAPWPPTFLWAVSIALVVVLRNSIARAVFAVIATLYAVSITVGNSGTVFGKHHFTGWHWALLVALDAAAAVFSVLCVLTALRWARDARRESAQRTADDRSYA